MGQGLLAAKLQLSCRYFDPASSADEKAGGKDGDIGGKRTGDGMEAWRVNRQIFPANVCASRTSISPDCHCYRSRLAA